MKLSVRILVLVTTLCLALLLGVVIYTQVRQTNVSPTEEKKEVVSNVEQNGVLQKPEAPTPRSSRVIARGVIEIDADYNTLLGLPPGGWQVKRHVYKAGTPGVVEYTPP